MGIRTSVARLCAVLLCLTAGWLFTEFVVAPALAQKPPPKEEEEEGAAKPKPKKSGEDEDPNFKAKPNHKVIRVGDENVTDTPAKTGDGAAIDLATAARGAKNPQVREFFMKLAEPHDLLSTKGTIQSGGAVRIAPYRIRPVEDYILDKDGNPRFPGRLKMQLFRDDKWEDDKSWDVLASNIASITFYEQTAVTQVNEFLKQTFGSVPLDEKLRAAKLALTAVLNFHESAVEQGKRRGEGFVPLAAALRQKLLDVQLQQLQALIEGAKADAAKWDQALDMANSLALTYTEAKDQARIVAPLAGALEKAMKANLDQSGSVSEEQLRRWGQIRQMFPTNAATGPVAATLQARAKEMFERATELTKGEKKDEKAALQLVKQAEQLWPRLKDLHDLRLKLENKLSELRVGVRELPRHFMPGLAFADSEKQAVELMFESLMKLSADSAGNARWQPSLADGRPKVVPLGRQFALARDSFWSNDKPVSPDDVLHTVRLLRNPNWPGYSPAWANLVEEPLGGDASHVTVTLSQGYIDPLSMMTFKVLPVEPWPGQTLTPGDEAKFDQAPPVASGPYVFSKWAKTPTGRDYVSFVANPAYGSRAGKSGQPRIREVQFFQTSDPRSDLQNKLIDMVTDVPNSAVESIKSSLPGVGIRTLPNRRIWFLAINHRHTNLQNQDLRKALAHAIDREAILDAVFRADLGKNVHKPLNGPFPSGSWACDPLLVFKKDLAKDRMKAAEDKGLKGLKLTLKYPKDPEITSAMELIKKQVQETIDVTLELEPKTLADLHQEVEVTQTYDLAYYWYDFPSQTYWLWPLFDPQATGPKGTNYLGYQNDGALTSQFGMILSRRDFAEVKKLTHTLHGMLFDKMPLIPLWQLDTHLALNNDLQATISDPLLVFTDVDLWRFEKK